MLTRLRIRRLGVRVPLGAFGVWGRSGRGSSAYVRTRMAGAAEQAKIDAMRSRLLGWLPRVLSIFVCLFLSVFSLDAFGNGRAVGDAIPDFAVHIAPVLILFAVVAVSWRRPLIGGIVFTGLAAGYAYTARAHPSWILVIGGPLFSVGLLWLWSWRDGGHLA